MRKLQIDKRLSCPRLYAEVGKTKNVTLDKCRACRYHQGDDGDTVKCGFPYGKKKSS